MNKVTFSAIIAVLLALWTFQVANAQTAPYITGGNEVSRGEYPSTVYMNTRGMQFGGVLIHEEWVLTCAHCLDSEIDAFFTIAQIGGIDKLSIEEGEIVARGTKKVIHPNYDPETHEYDLALLKIPKIAESEFTKISQIYTGVAEANVFMPITTTVSGWGLTEAEIDNQFLRAADLAYICRITGDTGMKCRDPYNPERGVCYGDSGSPLEIYTEEGRKLHSVVWGGNPCTDERREGGYTKVGTEKVLAWIDSVINAPSFEVYIPSVYR